MLLQARQVTLLLSTRFTVTGEPQLGQVKLRPFSSLADSLAQAGELQVLELHRAAEAGARRLRVVVEAEHLPLVAAQAPPPRSARPSSGRRGSSPCAETSATCSFEATV